MAVSHPPTDLGQCGLTLKIDPFGCFISQKLLIARQKYLRRHSHFQNLPLSHRFQPFCAYFLYLYHPYWIYQLLIESQKLEEPIYKTGLFNDACKLFNFLLDMATNHFSLLFISVRSSFLVTSFLQRNGVK